MTAEIFDIVMFLFAGQLGTVREKNYSSEYRVFARVLSVYTHSCMRPVRTLSWPLTQGGTKGASL